MTLPPKHTYYGRREIRLMVLCPKLNGVPVIAWCPEFRLWRYVYWGEGSNCWSNGAQILHPTHWLV